MLALTAAATDSAWSSGGALLTFYFPVGLFIVVVGLLYLQFASPHATPGRKPLVLGPASTTAAGPRKATTSRASASPAVTQPQDTSGPGLDQPRSADADGEPEEPKADA